MTMYAVYKATPNSELQARDVTGIKGIEEIRRLLGVENWLVVDAATPEAAIAALSATGSFTRDSEMNYYPDLPRYAPYLQSELNESLAIADLAELGEVGDLRLGGVLLPRTTVSVDNSLIGLAFTVSREGNNPILAALDEGRRSARPLFLGLKLLALRLKTVDMHVAYEDNQAAVEIWLAESETESEG